MATRGGNGSDWQRVPGKSRRYRNVRTGEEISRRQFLQRYGGARAYGTLEKKAKINRQRFGEETLLRPARGRTKATQLTGAERQVEINRRKVIAREKAADEKIARAKAKTHRVPTKITLRNFHRSKISRMVELPISYEAIEQVRQAAAASGIVWGYIVGANILTDMGERRTFFSQKMQHIHKVYPRSKYDDMLATLANRAYKNIVSLFIMLYLLEAVAEKRNGWVKKRPGMRRG